MNITDEAKIKLIEILNQDNSTLIRFGLKGSGCAGFEYYFANDNLKELDDICHQLDDTHFLLVDSFSSMYLEEATIDYKKDLMGESFVFLNPKATTKCGCGQSVSFD